MAGWRTRRAESAPNRAAPECAPAVRARRRLARRGRRPERLRAGIGERGTKIRDESGSSLSPRGLAQLRLRLEQRRRKLQQWRGKGWCVGCGSRARTGVSADTVRAVSPRPSKAVVKSRECRDGRATKPPVRTTSKRGNMRSRWVLSRSAIDWANWHRDALESTTAILSFSKFMFGVTQDSVSDCHIS
jgi:hypothetical protein